jgi:soluble lytic murein transglycosylase-like protein/Flp pilus assembly protein TadD
MCKIFRTVLIWVIIAIAAISGISFGQGTASYSRLTDAQAMLKSGNPDSARKILETADVGILYPYAQWLLANAYFQTHKPDEAYRTLARLLKDAPEFAMWSYAYGLSGRCLYERQGYERAVQRLKRFQRRFPDHPMAAECDLDLARSLTELGRYDEALSTYRDVILVYPGSKTYNPAFQEYLDLCDSLNIDPYDIGQGQLLGWARIDLTYGRYSHLLELASEYWKDLHIPVPEPDTEMLWLAAKAMERSRQISEARSQYEEIADRYPESPWAAKSIFALISMETQDSNFENASDYIKHLQELAPDDIAVSEARLTLGKALFRAGEQKQATSVLKKIVKQDQYSSLRVEALWYLGWIDWKRGRFRSAGKYWTKLLDEQPQDNFGPAARYWQARALASIEKHDDATGQFQKLAMEYPHNYYGILARIELNNLSLDDPQFVEIQLATEEEWDPFPIPMDTSPAANRYRLLTDLGLLDFAVAEGDSVAAKEKNPSWDCHRALLIWQLGTRSKGYNKARQLLEDSKLPPDSVAQIIYPISHRETIDEAAAQWKVPDGWIMALIRQESSFDVNALSAQNAQGLLQILPSTAEWIGKKYRIPNWEKLSDPAVNIGTGAAYFGWLMGRFNGEVVPVIAAHNAGHTAVGRWWPPESGDEAEWVESIPYRETRLFVKRVLTNAWTYAQLYPNLMTFQSTPANGELNDGK